MSTAEYIRFETPDLVAAIIAGEVPCFALIRRPLAHNEDVVDVLVGDEHQADLLGDLTSASLDRGGMIQEHSVLAILPFRQIRERGYEYVDDGEALRVLKVKQSALIPAKHIIAALPKERISVEDEYFDIDDQQYECIARSIIDSEIGGGSGSNFVLKRTYNVKIKSFSNLTTLSFYRKLLLLEPSAYWTFIVRIGDRTFVGATPERHVSLSAGVATMNPISGTYRYPSSGPTLEGLHSFLNDDKEASELYMVVDEELKMMARICDNGGTINGPNLKPMAKVAHTEYHISGKCDLPPHQILKETLFAPTITGSPLENACRVIKKYEPEGRGYYSGVIALIGQDDAGRDTLDSSILIRTADISSQGDFRIAVGATLVRDSNPASEAVETTAKASSLLLALKSDPPEGPRTSTNVGESVADKFRIFERYASIRNALTSRNDRISPFWLKDYRARGNPSPDLTGLSVCVVDAEDTFTSMIAHQLRSFGLLVTLIRFDEPIDLSTFDLVVMGPGPGNPQDLADRRIASLDRILEQLLAEQHPFLAVCLSHQILCQRLGLGLLQRTTPNQGVSKRIDLFGASRIVGFYNSFNAVCDVDKLILGSGLAVQVSRDRETKEVFALKSPFFTSFQFHAESVLSKDGDLILRSHLCDLARVTKPLVEQPMDHFSDSNTKGQLVHDDR